MDGGRGLVLGVTICIEPDKVTGFYKSRAIAVIPMSKMY